MEKKAYPYRPAKIYPRKKLSTKVRWYVKFFIWHHQEGAVVERRLYGNINYINSLEERMAAARVLRDRVNSLLERGWTIGKVGQVRTIKSMTVKEAMLQGLEIKKLSLRKGTIKNYPNLIDDFHEYLKSQGLEKLKISKLESTHVEHYLDYFLGKGRANKTRNNQLTNLSALLNVINRREKIFDVLPTAHISKLPTNTNKHVVFTPSQVQKIKAFCLTNDEEPLWFFILNIYFLLARPTSELRMIRVEHVDLINDRVYIPGDTAKGRAGDWVDLYPPLKEEYVRRQIQKYPPTHYLIGRNGLPAAEPVGKNHFYKHFMKVLEGTGITKTTLEYTLYSFKHTGCCALYLAGVDLLQIMRQCRHKSPEQTLKYLRDLGMLRKKDHFDKVQGI